MAPPLGTIGIWTSARIWPNDPGRLREAAAELDALGYGTLWLGAAPGDLALPEAVLEASERLVVATGIVNVWLAPAAMVADSFHRVTAAHPGRFLLGLGMGHAENVEGPTGQRYVRPLTRLSEYLDELDASSPPVLAPDRVIAALGPRALALAASRTAGAHPYLVPPQHTATARQTLGPEPLLAPEQTVVVEQGPAAARAAARRFLPHYLALPNYAANLRRQGFDEGDLAGGGSDRLVDAVVAWGDADAIRARLQEHLDAGADHVCIQVLSTDGSATLPLAELRHLAATLVS